MMAPDAVRGTPVVSLLVVGALVTGGIVVVLGGVWVGSCVRRL
ncbi:hypothetical protein [Pseudonocardia sp. NPDC046786]